METTATGRLPSTVYRLRCRLRLYDRLSRVLDDLTSACVYEMHSGHRTRGPVNALVLSATHRYLLETSVFYRVYTMVKFLKVRYR